MATNTRECICGHCPDVAVPPKDWIVTRLVDHGAGRFYRYRTEGINLNYPPCHPDRRFSWRVPTLDERYDLSNAETVAA
jgi:hypothetical protein